MTLRFIASLDFSAQGLLTESVDKVSQLPISVMNVLEVSWTSVCPCKSACFLVSKVAVRMLVNQHIGIWPSFSVRITQSAWFWFILTFNFLNPLLFPLPPSSFWELKGLASLSRAILGIPPPFYMHESQKGSDLILSTWEWALITSVTDLPLLFRESKSKFLGVEPLKVYNIEL